MDRFRQIGKRAQGQHGLVTLQQTREFGITRHEVDELVASGRWGRVAPRVFRISGAPSTWQARAMAEVLSAGPDAVASHRTAAALWGLDGFDRPHVIDITVPRRRKPRPRRGVRIHGMRDYDLAGRTKRQGVWVTGICRTLLDLCAGREDIAERGLHSARRLRLFDWRELWHCLFSHARQGRGGVTTLRLLLERWAGKEPPHTCFEAALRKLLVESGLPEPVQQHWVTAGGRRYRLDHAYVDEQVGLECKSRRDHFTEEAFEEDPVRDANLEIDGWLVLHITWRQMVDTPGAVVARVGKGAREASGEGGVVSRDAVLPPSW